MKKTITMIVVAILLLGLGITESILVGNLISDIENNVNDFVVEFEANRDNVYVLTDKIQEIEQKWDSKEDILYIMFNYKDIRLFADTLTRVSEYTRENNYDDGIVELKILQEYAKKNHDIMSCNFTNIF